jgi:small subunit ribosomal protein S20
VYTEKVACPLFYVPSFTCPLFYLIFETPSLINHFAFHHGKEILSFPEVDFGKEISYHTIFKKEKEMASHKSAGRQWRRSLRRNAINKRNKSALRSNIKKLNEAIKNKDQETAQKLLPLTFSLIDRSIKKGAIHENKGNRHKSRLSRQVEMINPSSPSK